MTSLLELREEIDKLSIEVDAKRVIEEGFITSQAGYEGEYYICHGWDIVIANKCDGEWGDFNLRLLDHIKQNFTDPESLDEALSKVQLGDAHWQWFEKHLHYRSDEYTWFFLIAGEGPQAACLIYHPKDPKIGKGEIFYIEYIAVAPWNRINPMCERIYKGVGSKIIKAVIEFGRETLGLRYGFCLHSLPTAKDFYESIGMKHLPGFEKEGLSYYEMPEEYAVRYVGE